MADQQQVDTPDPETIRKQMEQTRSALTQKLEVLEKKVTDTVAEATSAVAETVTTVKDKVESTVETVKDTVESTVETVSEALNLRLQVERHPWAMVGGSMAVGFLGGLFFGPPPGRQPGFEAPGPFEEPLPESAPPVAYFSLPSEAYQPAEPEQPSWFHQILGTFGSEIDKLKGLAISAVGGIVRDLVKEVAPEPFRPAVAEVIDDLTTKFGGHPLSGHVLSEGDSQGGSSTSQRAASS